MKPDEFEFVTELARAVAGLTVDPAHAYMIENRLGPAARREGFPSIRELLIATRRQRDEKLIWSIVEAVLVSETAFFRDMPVFRRFTEEMLPPAGPVRVLSAGCASGQEPYSLAMALMDGGDARLPARVELIGADLSRRALEKARSGLYTPFEVQRGLPVRHLIRYFEKREEMWSVTPALRARVKWVRQNLHGDIRPLGDFDVVFCRNVLSGLEPAARERVLDKLIAAVRPAGWLVLGADEAAAGSAADFERVTDGVYRRRGGARAAA